MRNLDRKAGPALTEDKGTQGDGSFALVIFAKVLNYRLFLSSFY